MPALAITVLADVEGVTLSTRDAAKWADLVGRLDRHRASVNWPTAADAETALQRVANDPRAVYSRYDGRVISEGRAFRVEIGAGAVALRVFDPARKERRASENPHDGSRDPGWVKDPTTGEWLSDESPRWQLPAMTRNPDGTVRVDAPRSYADGLPALAGNVPSANGLGAGLSSFLTVSGRQASAVASYFSPAAAAGRHGSVIREWSARSRARMLRAFAEIDYAPLFAQSGTPAMVTLTYPSDWYSLAPDGLTVKKHFRSWVERFFRTFGYRPSLLWKLEFQRRGAPHLHLFMMCPAFVPDFVCGSSDCSFRGYLSALGYCSCSSVPFVSRSAETFRSWLSRSWADVVSAPDVCDSPVCSFRGYSSALGYCSCASQFAKHLSAGTNIDFGRASRVTDPRRIAGYFLKHGTKTKDDKEYQHFVPKAWRDAGATPGRFWGFQGLERVRVVRDVDLASFVQLRRTLRRHARAHGRRRCYVGGRLAGGWTLAGDGPRFAALLAELVTTVVVVGSAGGARDVFDAATGEHLRSARLP